MATVVWIGWSLCNVSYRVGGLFVGGVVGSVVQVLTLYIYVFYYYYLLLQVCKQLQEDKESAGHGARLIMSMADQKLKSVQERQQQSAVALKEYQGRLADSLTMKNDKVEDNLNKLKEKQNEARQTKAVSRKERAEAARKRRDQLHQEQGGGDDV